MKKIPKGLRHMAAGAFFFSAMSALVKAGGVRFPSMELVWIRSLFVAGVAGTVLWRRRIAPAGKETRILALRGVLGFGGLSCFYYGVIHLPLAEATVIQYTNPVWTTFLAALFLGEWIGWSQVGLGLAALGGVLLVSQPSFLFGDGVGLDPFAVGIAFAGALFSAGAYATVRRLRSEEPILVLFWFGAMSSLLALPWAIGGGWRLPVGFTEWGILLGIGVTTHLGQWYLTLALRTEKAGRAMTVGYLQILFAATWGIAIWGDLPNTVALLGGAVILASVAGAATGGERTRN